MKKHIYFFVLLYGIGIGYHLFAGQEKETARIIELIESQMQQGHNGATALKKILQQAPDKESLAPGWKFVFAIIYPQWEKVYAESPETFRLLFEKSTQTQQRSS